MLTFTKLFLILPHAVKAPHTCSNSLLYLIMRGVVWLIVQWFEEIQTRFIFSAQQAGCASVWIVYG